MRLIDADAFCSFLREVSTRQHYETLLTKKDRYPTVADVIEEICCDLDGTSLNGFDNAPTVDTTSEKLAKIEQICKDAFSNPETQDINLYRAQALANIYHLFLYDVTGSQTD